MAARNSDPEFLGLTENVGVRDCNAKPTREGSDVDGAR